MTETKEKIAICIPTYNHAQYIETSIKSALNQEGPFKIEVWVSDDASTDNTEEIINNLSKFDNRIRYHKHSKNMGLAENRSWVLSQPQTEFLVYLDSDDILKPDFLLNLIPKMRKHTKSGYAHSATDIIDKEGKKIYEKKIFRSTEYLDSENALRESYNGMKTTCTILIFRKKALEEANYTRGRFVHGSDYDLIVRLADLGFGNVYTNKILCQYREYTDHRYSRYKPTSRIIGLLRTYEDSIVPAFKKRGWNLEKVEKSRKKCALNRSIIFAERNLSKKEKEEVKEALIQLGDSFSLRLRFFLYKIGFGKFFIMKNKLNLYTKNLIKNLLMRSSF